MIMDAIPSPQSVGREFVRQYYTLLNKAPDHLHRFYNNNSSFVHGGLDPHNREATLVVGQKQIYNKIQQLRFRDCHAKISQVDAQSTLGSGVVVQVTGELSNNGEPMRRFTQTFVLAAQSPKKYYVHNDIFRYQDELDDEAEVESRSENDEEQDQDSGNQVVENNNQTNNALSAQQQPQQQIFYPGLGAVPSYQQQQPAQLNGVVQHDEIQNLAPTNNITVNNNTTVPVQSQPLAATQQSVPVDPLVAATGTPNTQTAPTNAINELDNETVTNLQNDIEAKQNEVAVQSVTEIDLTEDAAPVQKDQNNANQEDVLIPKPALNEPKTYAQFFKSDNLSTGINFVSPTITNTTGRTPTNNTNSYASRTQQQDARTDSTPNTLTSSRSGSSRPGQIRERRSSNANQFSDNHQLFLGNVPHHATEDELKALFGRFGTVVDLRIHSKSGPKVPGMRAPPNYGFITYDDPESVQNCLSNMPLYYPDNSPDGQKLNVEEKKTRMVSTTNSDRNDRDRNDRGLNRTVSGGTGQRNSGDRDGPRGVGLNRTPNSGGMLRSGGPPGNNTQRSGPGNRPFNRNDRQQGGPRGNNNGTSNTSASGGSGGGGYGRR